jgi:hypothetical protein
MYINSIFKQKLLRKESYTCLKYVFFLFHLVNIIVIDVIIIIIFVIEKLNFK